MRRFDDRRIVLPLAQTKAQDPQANRSGALAERIQLIHRGVWSVGVVGGVSVVRS